MSKYISYCLLFLVFLSPLLGCDDAVYPKPLTPLEQLPEFSSEGRGTFGCLINGEAYVTRYPNANVDYTSFDFIRIGVTYRSPNISLNIGIYPYHGEDSLFQYPDAYVSITTWDTSSTCFYSIPENIEGYVSIYEYNPFDDYISGTFAYKAVNESCDTIHVTDGRFDLRVQR